MMSDTHDRLRIAIHIDVEPGVAGGTAQSTLGLVSSLGQLDGPEQFVLSTQTPQQADWIAAHRGPNQQIVIRSWRAHRRAAATRNGMRHPQTAKDLVKVALRPSVEAIRRLMGRLTPQLPTVPMSDGYYEGLGCDVLHFPT